MRTKRFLIPLLTCLVALSGWAQMVTISLNPSTNGAFSTSAATSGYYTTWTSNASSGVAGLTVTTGGYLGMCQQKVDNYGGNLLALKTTSGNTKEGITISAPSGYVIRSYSMTVRLYSSSTDAYTLYKTDGSATVVSVNGETQAEDGFSASSITLGLADTKPSSSNYVCVTSFSVGLKKENSFWQGSQITAEDQLVSGQKYILRYIGNGPGYCKVDGTTLRAENNSNYASPSDASVFTFTGNSTDGWKIRSAYNNYYLPRMTENSTTYTLVEDEASAATFALNFQSDGRIAPSNNEHSINRSSGVLHAWSSGTADVNKLEVFAFVEQDYIPSEVYTINNTNSGRGALIYNPDADATHVWSNGKSGTFDACQANSQWVIYPTSTAGQYYLYNVGAGKFVVNTGVASGTGNPWMFSDNAAPVVVTKSTRDASKYIIRAANGAANGGSNDAYMSVSPGNTYPIINWDDAGSDFVITRVEGVDASAEVTAAYNKLVENQTALTAAPTESGWYAMRIKTSGTTGFVGRFVKNPEAEYTYNGTNYPLSFTGAVDIHPSIADAIYYTYIDVTNGENSATWQMPNGKYLVQSSSNKFPVSSNTAETVVAGYASGNYMKGGSSNYYAVAYYLGSNYFVGESSTSKTFDVYPVDLAAAGLTAWKVSLTSGETPLYDILLSCTRSDVSGLTAVYNNGYFFLPAGVTPESSDFELDGMKSCTVDADAKTITAEYDPNLGLLTSGVTVKQGFQVTAPGNTDAGLLRIKLEPFGALTNTMLSLSLTSEAVSNVEKVTIYEVTGDIAEFYSASCEKTERASSTSVAATMNFNIGAVSTDTHNYWVAVNVKDDATTAAVIDAALTGITYTRNDVETTLTIDAGDPSDQGLKVYPVASYPFLPHTYDSNCYRIPAIVTANDGSLVAAADKRYANHNDIGGGRVIDIVVRRSTNGGKTWGAPITVAKGMGASYEEGSKCAYGDPTLVKCNDGTLVLTACVGNLGYGSGLKSFIVSKSTDNGENWTEPANVVTDGKLTNNVSGMGDFFLTSGHGLCTHDGVLMYLVVSKPDDRNYVIYSTDNGETWVIDNTLVYDKGNEAKLEELSDGSLVASIRQGNGRGFNFGTYTKNADGTVSFSWGTQDQNNQLHNGGSANNQDIFKYSDDLIFHTMTTGAHANLKLYVSIDNARNWKEVMTLQPGGARYVSMTKLESGDLGLLFEDGTLGQNTPANAATDGYQYPIAFITVPKAQIDTWSPVTYKVVDSAEGDVLAQQKFVPATTSVSDNMPTSLKRSFCTYEYYGDAALTNPITAIDGPEVYVKVTVNAPFEFSTAENPVWYFLDSNTEGSTTRKYYYANGNVVALADAQSKEKAYMWALVGNPYAVKLLNKQTGTYLTASALNGAGNGTTVGNTLAADGEEALNTFSLYGFTNDNVSPVNPFSLVLNGSKMTVVSGDGPLMYHSGIALNDALQLYNWKGANLEATAVPTTWAVNMNYVAEGSIKNAAHAGKSYATVYLPYDVTLPSGVKAYGIGTVADGYANLFEMVAGIPAQQGAILVAEGNQATLNLPVADVAALTETNILEGTLADKPTNEVSGTVYVFGADTEDVGLFIFSGETLGAYKAYLPLTENSGIRGFVLNFGDETTGIGAALGSSPAERQGIYDLQGRRVSAAKSGLYIVNGKKVLVP